MIVATWDSGLLRSHFRPILPRLMDVPWIGACLCLAAGRTHNPSRLWFFGFSSAPPVSRELRFPSRSTPWPRRCYFGLRVFAAHCNRLKSGSLFCW